MNLGLKLSRLLAEANSTPEALPEPTRTIALMGVLAIALLGLLMIVGTMLGAHWVRRIGSHQRGPAVPPDVLAPKPKNQPLPQVPQKTLGEGDTIGSDETLTS